jgi:hypothetical protein
VASPDQRGHAPASEGSSDGDPDQGTMSRLARPYAQPTIRLGWHGYRPRDVGASGAVTPESEVPMHDDPSNVRLLEAATDAIEAADLEFQVDDVGSHQLLRVQIPVEPWLQLQRATLDAGKGER